MIKVNNLEKDKLQEKIFHDNPFLNNNCEKQNVYLIDCHLKDKCKNITRLLSVSYYVNLDNFRLFKSLYLFIIPHRQSDTFFATF